MIRLITIGIFLVLANMLSAQPLIPVKVEGKVVTGPANDSVPFVNVFIINRHQGTITDNQGKFSFMANVGDTLLFSSMGFQSEKVVIPYDVSPKYHLEQHLVLDTLFYKKSSFSRGIIIMLSNKQYYTPILRKPTKTGR